ncbi:MXAN_5187 C-terminal domain-containing protein [Anaeromyxobacter sp. Red801]|uniref:MXAN_5187 C-terminal domain-containing protein n=1 Tax=Anaeromyxobacter sp. Red801 TaxID=3411632 RepID=UPI003BA1EF15
MALPPQKPGRPAGPPPSAEEAARAARHATDELTDETAKLEEELEALKARYEQYFLGTERREPARWRDEVRKKVLRLKGAFTRNTGLRFRIQSLHARYLSYERLWQRSVREREEGTYRRDLLKARRHARDPEAAPAPGSGPAATPAPAGGTSPAVNAPPPPARTPAPPPAQPGAADEGRMRALYDAYIAAKRQCNEDVSRLSYDVVARSVAKQVPEVMARFKARSVDFRVEVKDGKAILKAIPRV